MSRKDKIFPYILVLPGIFIVITTILRHKPPCHNGIEKPRRSQLRGFLRATMSTFVFLAYWHYSICLSAFQVCPTSTTYKPYALQVLSLGCSPLLFPEGCFLSILRQSSPCLVSLVELCPCPHSLFQG